MFASFIISLRLKKIRVTLVLLQEISFRTIVFLLSFFSLTMAKNLTALFGSAIDKSAPLSSDATGSASSPSASTGKSAGGWKSLS